MTRAPSALTPGTRLTGIERIAVLRANALGDFLLTLPALDALRAAYPEAEITLLGRSWHASFLAGRPSPVDRVISIPVAHGVREEHGETPHEPTLERFFREMAAERFDLALQLHGGGRYSNPFVARLGARVTAGLQAPAAHPRDLAVPYVELQHETLRFLEVGALVGAAATRLEPCVQVTEADRREAAAVVGPDLCPLAVLHPGAMDPRRRWSASRFAAIGDALRARGMEVVVTGSSAERELAGDVCSAMEQHALNVAGTLSISGLAGLLERAAIVVSNDSGPRHLAAAVGTPTVAIYWFRNMLNTAPLASTHHRAAVSWCTCCPVCGASCIEDDPRARGTSCAHRASLVDDVTTDAVWAHVDALLARVAPVSPTGSRARPWHRPSEGITRHV
jgi:ADP-heptose:LPS heptosyltransferase